MNEDAPPAATADRPVVLVDARNVLRSVWPNLGEQETARLTCSWAAARGCRALLIYDGAAPRLDGGCPGGIVVGSGKASADDLIVAEAARLAASSYPYWLVTSDRAVRAAAGPAAVRTIGGGAFARELRASRATS
jgi:hypothetical protein